MNLVKAYNDFSHDIIIENAFLNGGLFSVNSILLKHTYVIHTLFVGPFCFMVTIYPPAENTNNQMISQVYKWDMAVFSIKKLEDIEPDIVLKHDTVDNELLKRDLTEYFKTAIKWLILYYEI